LRPLTVPEKLALKAALGNDLEIEWYERPTDRWKIAKLSGVATDIRLRAPEAFAVHRTAIDWVRKFSPTGLPSRTLGFGRATLPFLKWAMEDWARLNQCNRWVGTWFPRIQMDYIPGYACAAHFTIRTKAKRDCASRVHGLLEDGQAIQRFWLTASQLRLAMQPNLALLAFTEYGAKESAFTGDPGLLVKAQRLARSVSRALGSAEGLVFAGRIGEPTPRLPTSRSTRQTVTELSTKCIPAE
jgi:hypothetical protein